MNKKIIIVIWIILSFVFFFIPLEKKQPEQERELEKSFFSPHLWYFPMNISTVKAEKEPAVELTTADVIWQEMRSWGYSEYICAGIIGNMMAEAGGHTLDIQHNIYSSSGNYYGICQWSKKYHNIENGSLQEQLNYLKETIKYELNAFGYKYQQNFNYDSFLKIADPAIAAEAFAKCYERCSSTSHEKRKQNALLAYSYFIQKEKEGIL